MPAWPESYQGVESWKLWAADQPDYLTNAAGDSLDEVIEDCLKAASRDIDGDTGRVFYKIEQEERWFRVSDTRTVSFVDAIAGADIAVLVDDDGDDVPETALAATDYHLMPFTDDRGRASERYNKLVIRRGASRTLHPGQAVKITTDWGYIELGETPPANIIMACNLRAGYLFARREAKLGAISVPGMGTVGMVKGRDQGYLDSIKNYIIGDDQPVFALT